MVMANVLSNPAVQHLLTEAAGDIVTAYRPQSLARCLAGWVRAGERPGLQEFSRRVQLTKFDVSVV